MTAPTDPKLLIVGGGLAGSLAALALAERRPDISFRLVESGDVFGGNHLWSFFDPDVEESDRWLVEPFVEQSWPAYDICFPRRRRTLFTGYNSASSSRLNALVRDRLRPDQYRLGQRVRRLTANEIVLDGGEILKGEAVIDARGFALLPEEQREALDLRWQKFVGRDVHLDGGHRLDRPIVMDATVIQTDGYRFVYSLPFDPERLLVEDTYYSDSHDLDREVLRGRIDCYMADRNWQGAELRREEDGVLPVALGGDFNRFWPATEVGRLGVMGGFFHPTTGYSLPDAVQTALLLTRQADFSGPGLAGRLRAEAERLWRDRGFYRLLNRMLFRASAPDLRYRVLEHFYRLDEGLIGRFYAARLRTWDKIRILSGRPPVPILPALAAMVR